ncbi:hypothetical protein [Xenorhabdus budapestensis]|uniref:Glycosyltransferase n=1 Tax=Xenorhabdus budapestensis TaxID=290110 RepID=A0A2D0IWD8_XENBU|nr:hypothetical protein [Xenorhabdus budapestensis]PHM26217.1 hypothetical protein Xbud_02685 [Xenorhabdus budapestensis]
MSFTSSKKILILEPHALPGSPAKSRVTAFQEYFENKSWLVLKRQCPKTIFEKIKLIIFLLRNKNIYLLISMPEFRGFFSFLIPNINIILDIRDGWSIEISSGYGGDFRKKKFKAKIAKVIERIMIKRSYLTITCTLGLQKYLEEISAKKILVIPNGILFTDIKNISIPSHLTQTIQKNKDALKNKDTLIFCCAGKFSEYGTSNVKKLLNVILERYSNNKIKIHLVGSNKDSNQWVIDYFYKISNGRGTLDILPSLEKKELFNLISKSDLGIALLRSPDYEYGTKVFDYILQNKPVVNYFDKPNNFTIYFDAVLDRSFNLATKIPEIDRINLIKNVMDKQVFK